MSIQTDSEGFLLDPSVWDEDVAKELAEQDGRELTGDIMSYINQAREMYARDGVVPPLRKFCKDLGISKADLYGLFQMGPMKLICKWGGLPKPTGCV